MSHQDKMELDGTVTKVLPGTKFIVELTLDNGTTREVTCTISGKLRKNYIKIIKDDKVTVEISPYDLTRGVITWRTK